MSGTGTAAPKLQISLLGQAQVIYELDVLDFQEALATRFADLWAEGRAMLLEQALTYALKP